MSKDRKRKPHPEDFCQLCGRKNMVWYVSNELWNKVIEPLYKREIICCPICFAEMAEKQGINPTAWRLSREGDSQEVDELRIEIANLTDKIRILDGKIE